MSFWIENLAEREIESLVKIMDSSCRVGNRSEYGQWTKTELGPLFSHEIMVSMAKGTGKPVVHVEKALAVSLSHEQIAHIFCADGGLMDPLMASWKASKRPYLENADGRGACDGAVASEFIRRHELGNIAAHGVEDLGGDVIAFFCFARVADTLAVRHAYLLEMIIPHLNVAFTRAYAGDAAQPALGDGHDHPLTLREKEIMRWVKEGKSNWEVATILSISELTVKNHLHKILRKLSAQSRGHAVAKAIRLNII